MRMWGRSKEVESEGGLRDGQRLEAPDRGKARRSLHALAALAVLLCACLLPVFAASAEPPAESPASVEATTVEEMSAALGQAETEQNAAEEAAAEQLATPEAEEERENSETAYAQLDASEASELLIEKFSSTMEQLNDDPGRVLTDMEVEEMLGPNAARVASPTGERSIVEASLPLSSDVGGDEVQPLDLTLNRTDQGFVPENPGTPTTLPVTATEPVEVGEGVQVEIPTTSDQQAVQVGEMDLFYPETAPTTDTMLAPVAGGVEIFAQLRSPASPEEMRFPVTVPDGAQLMATDGGAEVVSSDGTTLEKVPPPTAVDANGTTVATTMKVEGDALVLAVDLAEAQPEYPVLVDPLIYVEEQTNFGAWGYDSNAAYGATWDAAHLEVWSAGNHYNYPPYTHGAYTYTSPGPTAWIEAATFSPIYFFPNSCGGNQPHGYIGLYNPGAAHWESLGVWEGVTPTGGSTWQTGWVGHPGTEWAVFGIGTNGTGTSLSCVHEFYLGGYSLQEKDTTNPVVTSVSGVPLNQWFDPANVGAVTITAEDTGFGIWEVSVGNEGGVTNSARPNNCSGVFGSRCPHVFNWQINPPYKPGKREFKVNAQDAMRNNTPSGFMGYTYVDSEKPALEFTGQFARATDEVGFSSEGAHHPAEQNELSLPGYVLHISALDGSNANSETMQSGVQRVQVFLDGVEQALSWGVQTCPASESSCSLAGNYTLKPLGLSAGIHKLRIVATDRVGLAREREIEFEFIPATGEGGNQVLERFPLHPNDGVTEPDKDPRPEVAVNIMNGNLVFHQQDAEVATSDAGLGIERYYNSQLPQAQSGEFGTGWTVNETPELEPGKGGAGKATIVDGDGAMQTAVPLPAQEGQQTFDPATRSSVAKVVGGYSVTDEGEESTPTAELAGSGQPVALQGSAEAVLDLEREGGELSEIAVDDPGTATGKTAHAVTESPRGYLLSAQAGGAGSAGGNLSRPAATATDSAGNVYVADVGHDRVQVFDKEGKFLRQWGGAGTGAGQFSSMVGIAIGENDNVFVAEPTRIEQFTSTGTFVRQIGSAGTGNGQFAALRAISITPSGPLAGVLVALDEPSVTGAYRVQSFFPNGTWAGSASVPRGTGTSSLSEPGGIAVEAAAGLTTNLWVADTGNNRVQKLAIVQSGSSFTAESKLRFGTAGTGNGQFARPQAVAVDPSGNVWVTDTGNNRVEAFNSLGRPVSRFGRVGGDEGQLSQPIGIAVDGSGSVWVASVANHRINRWTPTSPGPTPPVLATPAAEVDTAAGLVQSIKGPPTGSITYQHQGSNLTGVTGPEGTSHYTYDAQNRMHKIELPHATSAEIEYDAIGRVASLKVVVEGGTAETTTFQYDPEGVRETIVRRPTKKPAMHYAISEDGWVLRWWNTPKEPEIEELTGSLWAQRGEASPGTITIGDQSLEAKAYSPEGLHSLQIVANGSQVVAEKTCEKSHDWECLYLERIYVTETQNWPPGIVSFEVIATDSLGFTSTRRFWDNFPYTPPPENNEFDPPTYEGIQRFREDFGLDLDLKGNERATAERIFNLIDAWHEPGTPEGQVARASAGRWGVPLRAADVAEMEYRERYAAQAARLIPQWAESHAQSTYAGYYIDHRQGGLIRVGFKGGSQAQQLSSLVSEIGEIAPGRMTVYSSQPTFSYRELLEAWRASSAAMSGQPIASSMVSQAIDMAGNRVEIKTEDVAGTEAFLSQHVGLGRFAVSYAAGRPSLKALPTRPALYGPPPKYNNREAERRIFGGDSLIATEKEGTFGCTAGWGATQPIGQKPNGEGVLGSYLITAGHCWDQGSIVYRIAREGKQLVEFPIGTVSGRSYGVPFEGHETDAESIALRSGFSPPSWIFANQSSQLRPGSPALPVVGAPVCHSGVEGGFSCGTVKRFTEQWFEAYPEWVWETNIYSCDGDSGGPYWQPEGNIPLGIETGGPSYRLADGRECGAPEYFTPLVESRTEEMGVLVGRNVGVFGAPGLNGLTFYGAIN